MLIILLSLLTPTRRLLHQQLSILSAASQVIEPSPRTSLARLLLLIATTYHVSALYGSVFGSLLVHLEQLIVVLAGATTGVNLQSLFIGGHSLTGQAALRA